MTTPTLTDLGPSVTFAENTVNATPQIIDSAVTFTDPDDNFDTGTLTVTGLLAEDRVSINNEGNAAGQIGFAAGVVSYGGTPIGTATGGAGSTLTVTFNADATSAAIDALIQNLSYANSSDNPTPSRVLAVMVTDAAGEQTNVTPDGVPITVDVTAENDAPTFAVGNGQVFTDFGQNSFDYAYGVTLQSDGRIVAAGIGGAGASPNWAIGVVRYNADGSLDTSLGGDGTVAYDFGDHYRGNAVALQPDGKIVVGGYQGLDETQFAVARYNADGSLDTSFNTTGFASTGFGSNSDQARAVAVQSGGGILLAGYAWNGSNNDFALARYTSTGALDTTFDGDGKVTTAFGSDYDMAFGMALQSDDKAVVVGFTGQFGADFAVARYNLDGSLDTTFSGDGMVTTELGANDVARDVAIQADGKIVVVGETGSGQNNAFAVVRYNADGTLDSTFDGDGIVITAVGSPDAGAVGVVVQSDGKIVVAGRSGSNPGSYDLTVVRYNADGSLDTTFDGDGIANAQLPYLYASVSDVAVQPDGGIVLVGGRANDFHVVRFNADGSLDTDFGPVSTLGDDPFPPFYVEGDAPTLLDDSVTVNDAELNAAGQYAGASVTLVRDGGANAEDLFSADSFSNVSELVEGQPLELSGVTIGTVTQNSGGTLVLTFTDASQAQVNEVLSSIAYANSSDEPPSSVQIDWTFSDGNTGAQGAGGPLSTTGSITVEIFAVSESPVISNLDGDSVTFTEGDDFVRLDLTPIAASVADSDSTDFDGGGLLVEFCGCILSNDDVLFIRDGNGITVDVNTFEISYNGELIGEFFGGGGFDDLFVEFTTTEATAAAVSALLGQIAYQNTNIEDPEPGIRTLGFTVFDGGGGFSLTSEVELDVVAVNDAPTADDAGPFAGIEDQAARIEVTLSGNDIEWSDDVDSFIIATLPAHGQLFSVPNEGLALAAGASVPASWTGTDYTATVYFQPNADWNGATSFTYQAFDGDDNSAPATASITVSAVVDIANDMATTNEDTAVNIPVLDNDTFENVPPPPGPPGPPPILGGGGPDGPAAITATTDGAHGTVTVNDSGTPDDGSDDFLVYAPDANFQGTDSFTYTVTSGGVDETATVNVTVNSVNDAPVAAASSVATDQNTARTFAATNFQFTDANDNPANGLAAVVIASLAAHGTLSFNGNAVAANDVIPAGQLGLLVYTPTVNYLGPDSFTFRVRDNGGTANGGVDLSANAAAMSIAVGDIIPPAAPVIQSFAANTGSPTDNITTDSTLHLTGTAEAGSTVRLFDGGTLLGDTTASGLGSWAFDTAFLPSGSHSFRADATDVANNTGALSAAFAVNILPQPAAGPAVPFAFSGIAADFDGDGLNDVLQIHQGSALVWLSTGASFTANLLWANGATASDRAADVNGDGAADLVQYFGGNFYAALSNGGSAFGPWSLWASGATASDQLGDFNGDGRVDLLQLYNGNSYVALSNGSSFGAFQQWGSGSIPSDRVLEADQDNRADLFQIYDGHVWTSLSNGTSFNEWHNGLNGVTSDDRPADVNGDGIIDVVQYYNGNLYVALANNPTTGFSPFSIWRSGATASDQLGDFNGDGRTDALQLYNGTAYVALSNGAGFGGWTPWASGATAGDRPVDLNGDDRLDLLQVSDGHSFVALSNGSSFDAWHLWV